MKTSFFSILLLSLSLSASPLVTQDPTVDYQPIAQQWAQKVTTHVDRYFIPDLLEFVYASYMRSYMTLVVQSEYLQLLSRIGSGWDHIISTRLNPSKDKDFDISTVTIDETFIQQIESFAKNGEVQKNYVELLNRLADDEHPFYPGSVTTINYNPCRKLIDELRDNSRTAIAESLIQALDEIQQEIQKAQELISQAAELFKSEGQLKNSSFINRSITELLWYYAPSLMVKSFANFDKGYTTGSKQCFNAYIESQQIGNEIWRCIEVARASYYAAHYQALYTMIENIDPEMYKKFEPPNVLTQQLIDYTCSI